MRSPPPQPAPRSSSSGWGASLAAGPATGIGLLPNLALAGEVRLALVPPSWPALVVSAMVWDRERALVSGGGTSGATLGLWTAGLALCPLAAVGKSRALSSCLGAEVGRLRASGFGFDKAFDKQSWTVDLSAGGRLRQQIGGDFFVALDLRAVVPLLRDRITFVGADGASRDVFRMWPVTAVGGLEVGYTFHQYIRPEDRSGFREGIEVAAEARRGRIPVGT